jgi:hypothetical protein
MTGCRIGDLSSTRTGLNDVDAAMFDYRLNHTCASSFIIVRCR